MELQTGPSRISGTGCFAGRAFRKGEIVGEYTGERISEEEAEARYDGEERTYLFVLEDGSLIDAMHDPNPVKYINHCCNPNCESEETSDGRIVIKALRDISAGEELTYDYNLIAEEDDTGLDCHCGAPGCRGTMLGEQ